MSDAIYRKVIPKGALVPSAAAPPARPTQVEHAGEALRLARAENDALRPEAAVAMYRRALELDAGNGEAARELGLTLFDAGEGAEACALLSGFLERHAGDQETRLVYASLLIRSSELDRAEQQLVRCIDRDPRWAPPYVPLIRLLWRAGRQPEARARLHAYRALLPDPRTVEMLESMLRG